LYLGETAANVIDGFEGRDNAWGSVVLPTFGTTFGSTHPSDDQTQAIHAGKWTLQIRVTGLDGTPTQTALGLSAQVFASDALGADAGSPAFDPTMTWPVSNDSVDGGDVNAGVVGAFSDGYVTGGTFVAGAFSHVTVPLHLGVRGAILSLRVHEAIVTFNVTSADEIQSGVLAGVLDPSELAAAMQGTYYRTYCNGTPPDNDTFARAVDILADRTNKQGAPCVAVSFAIGFHGKRIANPTSVAPPPGVVDPCADASAD
jgi:hypothetical protein